jgi:ParB-like chromosome segregation protein Spo0J
LEGEEGKMAVSFVGEIGRAETTYSAYPEEIVVVPELNGRHEHTDVETLASDIEKNEQLQPVVCRKNDAGNPVLVFGHRRYRAICLLNERNPKSPRKVIFTYKKYSEAEAFIAAIGENRFRKDVSPIDDAANIEVFRRKFGKSDEEIAKIYFPEAITEEELKQALRFVKDRAALIELDPAAAQAVREGRIKITAAVALSKLSREQQRKKVTKAGKIKGKDVKTPKPAKNAPGLAARVDAALDSSEPMQSNQSNYDRLIELVGEVIESAEVDEIEDPVMVWVQVHRAELASLKAFYDTLK